MEGRSEGGAGGKELVKDSRRKEGEAEGWRERIITSSVRGNEDTKRPA